MPAGTEIKERTTGTNLPKNKAKTPFFWKNLVALSRSLALKRSVWPTLPFKIFSRRSTDKKCPTAYKIAAPKTAPIVAAVIAPKTFSPAVNVKNPVNVKTTSEGIGGKIFSRAISSAIPRYPYCPISSVKTVVSIKILLLS